MWSGRQKSARVTCAERRKEQEDGGDELWPFLPQRPCTWACSSGCCVFRLVYIVGNPNSRCCSTTILGVGVNDDKQRPHAYSSLTCFVSCLSPSATQSRRCSLWYTFYSFHSEALALRHDLSGHCFSHFAGWMEVCRSLRSEFVLYLDIQGQGEKTVGFEVIQIQVWVLVLPLTDSGQTTETLRISFPHLKNVLVCTMGGRHFTGFCGN